MSSLLKYSVIVAAIITGLAALCVPLVTKIVESRQPSPVLSTSTAPPSRRSQAPPSIVQKGDDDFLVEQRDVNAPQVIGNHNQVTMNPPASTHPVTFGMGLKWTVDDFAETVRNGNLSAIKEYLNPKDGFDPNALWEGNVFVLQLPIFEGTKNFPEILTVFRETGKLNWNEQNERSLWARVYGHPITLQWALLQEAANKNHPADLKALLDAGANPSQLLADAVKGLHQPVGGGAIYQGALTGKATDMRHANLEQELATFKSIGYSLPNLTEAPPSPEAQRQASIEESRKIEACKQDIRTHHSLKEMMELATNPTALSRVETWQPFQMASSSLSQRLMQGGWRGDRIEYESAITKACSPQTNSNPF